MSSVNKSVIGGKKGGKGRKKYSQSQNQHQNQHQNQNGGEGNSSALAESHGGIIPMVNYKGGAHDLASSPYAAGNANVGGAAIVPTMNGGSALVPTMNGGNPLANLIPNMDAPANVGGSKDLMKGGNMLNNLAVPAVLLYANNTFGKRKTGKKSRKFRRNGKKSRRFRKR